MRLLKTILCVFLFVAHVASARADSVFVDGKDTANACRTASIVLARGSMIGTEEAKSYGFCLGAIQTVLNSFVFMDIAGMKFHVLFPRACVPASVTEKEIVNAVVRRIDIDNEAIASTGYVMLQNVLAREWPCQDGKQGTPGSR